MSESDARVNSYRLSCARLAIRLQPSAIALPNILEMTMNRTLKNTLSTAASTAVASLVFASAAPAASDKATDQTLDACIQHFVASNLADYQGKVTVEKSESSAGNVSPSLLVGGGNYYVTVSAVGRPGGVPIASATCRIGRDGSIKSMKTVPLAALKKLRSESVVVAKNDIK
jgi:hypothetical protein